MGAIGLVFLPFVVAIALLSPWHAAVTALGILAASAAAIAIQHWFRTQAKRSHFRRRQTSSRVATLCGGVLVDRLGRYRGTGRGRHLVRRCGRRVCGGDLVDRAADQPKSVTPTRVIPKACSDLIRSGNRFGTAATILQIPGRTPHFLRPG